MASQRRSNDEKTGPTTGTRSRVDPYAPAREAGSNAANLNSKGPEPAQPSFVVPLAIALAVFVVLIVARLLLGDWGAAR